MQAFEITITVETSAELTKEIVHKQIEKFLKDFSIVHGIPYHGTTEVIKIQVENLDV